MEQRQIAFNEFFAWWKSVNPAAMTNPDLFKGAVAAGWNAALDYAKKQLDR